jgi:protein-L-isoaspartate O-methyltransferase
MYKLRDQKKLVRDLQIKKIIKSSIVARAMSEVDRADFTNYFPYIDCQSPLGYQTHIEAPSIHA